MLCQQITLSNIKDIVLIIMPVATFILALVTVNKWKKEHKAKTYFDCSFRFLKSVYALRDNFNTMRSAFYPSWEHLPKTSENKDDYERQNAYHIFNNRHKPFQEALSDFYSMFPEVEVLFGEELIKVCWDINLVVSQYRLSLNEYLQLVGTDDKESLIDLRKDIVHFDGNDKLKDDLEAAIEKIRKAVSKHIDLKL